MKRVIIESPYAGDIPKNTRYLQACMHDCIVRHNESPFASHGLYTQPGVLVDEDAHERELGIQAGFVWRAVADKTVVYCDLGFSRGMKYGIEHAKSINHPIEYRSLGEKRKDFGIIDGLYPCPMCGNPYHLYDVNEFHCDPHVCKECRKNVVK